MGFPSPSCTWASRIRYKGLVRTLPQVSLHEIQKEFSKIYTRRNYYKVYKLPVTVELELQRLDIVVRLLFPLCTFPLKFPVLQRVMLFSRTSVRAENRLLLHLLPFSVLMNVLNNERASRQPTGALKTLNYSQQFSGWKATGKTFFRKR